MDVKDRLGPLPIFYAMKAHRWRTICREAFELNVVTTVTGKGRVAVPNRFARLRSHAGKGLRTAEIMVLTRGES